MYAPGDPVWVTGVNVHAGVTAAGEVVGPADHARYDWYVIVYEFESFKPDGGWNAYNHQLRPRSDGRLSQHWARTSETA